MTSEPPVLDSTKTFGQKIAYFFAMLFFVLGCGFIAGALLYEAESKVDPIHGSLLASVIFCFGVGVVLYVIGTARLKGLLSGPRDTV